MSFDESKTVEHMILDALSLCGRSGMLILREDPSGWGGSLGTERLRRLAEQILAQGAS